MRYRRPELLRSCSVWANPFWDRRVGFSYRREKMKSLKPFPRQLIVMVVFIALVVSPLHSHTFYVTNTLDDGSEGTFRWAVEMCDWYPIVRDTILFAIPTIDPGYDPVIGVWTIRQDTLGNTATYHLRCPGVLIDGFSQREFIGYDTNPLGPEIELKGPREYGYDRQGIDAAADSITIRGLCINGFRHTLNVNDVDWDEGEVNEGSVVAGCYLNTDPTGSDGGSEEASASTALNVGNTRGFRLGGDGPEERNIIAGANGIEFKINLSGGFHIISNIIGLDRTGTRDLSSAWATDLQIGYNPPGSGPCVIRGNVIAGEAAGENVAIIEVLSDSTVLTFENNLMGVGMDGSLHGGDQVVDIYGSHIIFRENVIADGLTWGGLVLWEDQTDYVTITRNSIYACNNWLGIQLDNDGNSFGVDWIDGQYGPGVNEEIDPCVCDSIVNLSGGEGGTTEAFFTCMKDCTVEVFIGDGEGYHGWCSLPGYGDVVSGKTYLGDAQEVIAGDVFSSYRFQISPALAEGTLLTTTATNQNGSTSEFGCSCAVPVIGNVEPGCLPAAPRLLPPVPNPSDGSTILRYVVASEDRVRVAVYDVLGREVATVVNCYHAPGRYSQTWDCRDGGGERLPGGSYIIRMESEEFVGSMPMTVLR